MEETFPRSTPPRRATLKDVARAAGVSQSTTSRALSGEGYVAAAARDRIVAAADELGYVPHAMARSLRKQVSRSVGVLVSDLRNTFYADLAAGIAGRARSRGYTMMLVDDQGLLDQELHAAQAFVATRAAGVIVTPLSADVSTYLLRQRIPVVEVDRRFSAGACDAVVIDNASVARRMTDHLIALGHRRIALLIDETDWTTGSERFAGYTRSLADSGIPDDPSLVVSAGWDVGGARKAAVGILTRRDAPTAVFAANNLLAEGVWRAASDLGLRIPDDLSIVSFDDAQWMSMVSPGVTAIAQDAVALGEAAMDRLLDRIEDPDAAATTTVLEAQILPRGSTSAPRPA
ncbi:LacI family DNA-binding transcriptional regulator [Planctomonas psychrotolerans]|uniref:LacI family DNA-binding transcriptional regulator n=1 Tax=Planctomonas psychrotolerans TaxID=2528712 RepID=UPI0012387BC4|nr:LacI family DNA-binding transcriptional regulator [Planctomonas psychrotolerans]